MVAILGLWRRASLFLACAALLFFADCAGAPARPPARAPAPEARAPLSAPSGTVATPPPFLDPAVLHGTLPGPDFNELAAITKTGIADDYLVKVREELRRRDEADRKTDTWWLARIADAYRYGDDFARANDVEAVIARVTSDDVKKTLSRLFDPHHYVLVTMQPGAGAASPSPEGVRAPSAPLQKSP